jgi:hypothetical protein
MLLDNGYDGRGIAGRKNSKRVVKVLGGFEDK